MTTLDSAQQADVQAGTRSQPNPKRWWVLVVLGLAQLMVVLDTTVVNIALPSAQQDLGFGNDGSAMGGDGLRARVRQPAVARGPVG